MRPKYCKSTTHERAMLVADLAENMNRAYLLTSMTPPKEPAALHRWIDKIRAEVENADYLLACLAGFLNREEEDAEREAEREEWARLVAAELSERDEDGGYL